MRLRSIAKLLLVALLAGTSLVACGDDDSGVGTGSADGASGQTDLAAGDPADDNDDPSDAADAGSDEGGPDGSGGFEVSEDLELRAAVTGIKVAMMADEVEVVDSVIHVYMGENALLAPGTECMIATKGAPDGVSVVIHRDGTETPC